ncbi:MAG: stage II sporulation protein M [Candidatus Aenigmarchaeota archaeon]|nr:stage II sporulation protein M [Candidatus Aenigmarchaeota archaeon]
MVLESIISARQAVRHPVWMFFIGVFIAAISLFISFLVFPQSIGMFTSIVITFIMTPLMVNLLLREEVVTEVELRRNERQNFLQRHKNIITVYVAFFSGVIISLSLIFLFLPEATVNSIFQDQINAINIIRGSFLFSSTFLKISLNNIGVLLIAFLFSLIFGSGAIFILAWNASVLSTAIGLTAKSVGGLHGIPIALMTYLPHGIFEIMAYFLGGIAGGILSAALMKRKTKLFSIIVKDSLKVLGLAIFLLLVGAVIETFVIVV